MRFFCAFLRSCTLLKLPSSSPWLGASPVSAPHHCNYRLKYGRPRIAYRYRTAYALASSSSDNDQEASSKGRPSTVTVGDGDPSSSREALSAKPAWSDPPDVSPPGDTLYLLDALGLIYRSYHALFNVTLSSRLLFDTRAVYGFTLVLLSLISGYARGNTIVAVFEGMKTDGKTDFRTEQYPSYKANRMAAPAGVREAVPWVKEVVRALGLAVIEVDLFEADDVIGTLARRAQRAAVPTVIVSADKDFRQLLVKDWIRILRPMSKSRNGSSYEYVSEETFRADFAGLDPKRYIDVLALIGDKADNVPGVPGIGEKTAPGLIANFGTLENLLDAVAHPDVVILPGVSARHVRLLREHTEIARISKRLVTIEENVKMATFEWDDLRRKPVDRALVGDLIQRLDFSKSNILHRMLIVDEDVPEYTNCNNYEHPGQQQTQQQQQSQHLFQQQQQRKQQVPHQRQKQQGQPLSDPMHAPMPISISQVVSIPHEPLPEKSASPMPTIDYRTVATRREMDAAVSELYRTCEGKAVGIGVVPGNMRQATLGGIALSAAPGVAIYFDTRALQREGSTLPEILVGLLSDHEVDKRGWCLKEAGKILRDAISVDLCGRLFDVRIACELLHAGRNISDSAMALRYLENDSLSEYYLPQGRQKCIEVPRDAEAALKTADFAFRIADAVQQDLDICGMAHVADAIEFPLISVLAEMERVGVPFRVEELAVIQEHVESQLRSIEEAIRELVPLPASLPSVIAPSPDSDDSTNGSAVNANSDKPSRPFKTTSSDDVAKLLFVTWGIPIKAKTSTGKASTDKRALMRIAENEGLPSKQRDFARLMLKHRELSKIATTYTKSLTEAISSNGRIHATFTQDASASGRLSTSSPNLQSIPARSDLGRKLRSTVQAEKGFHILCADYSQIELRILAALSRDDAMISAFTRGDDVHAIVASRIFGLGDSGEVTKEQRNRAKAVSYGIPYGISPSGLAQQLNIGKAEARDLITGFCAAYPGIEQLTTDLIDCARDDGYAETLSGRKLHLPLLVHGSAVEQRAAERVAINMPIQGTQADMIKRAMICIDSRLVGMKAKSRMILQLHDELVLEVADDELADVVPMVCEEMCNALPLPNGVNVIVKSGVGSSWQAAEDAATIGV
jgi:DNA polymerase I